MSLACNTSHLPHAPANSSSLIRLTHPRTGLYLDDPSDDWFCYTTLTGHTSTVWSLSFSPCGNHLASASDDSTVRIWSRLDEVQCKARGLQPQGKVAGRAGDRWVCTNVLKGWFGRTVYSVDWAKGREGTLGRLAAAGGDGRICVWEIARPEGEEGAPVATLIASVEDAHGVSDINCVSWGPLCKAEQDVRPHEWPDLDPEADGSEDAARFEEIGEDDDAEMGGNGSDTRGWNHLLASTADDGSLRVWRVPIVSLGSA